MGKDYEVLKNIEERNRKGREAELDDDLPGAISLYEENIKEDRAHSYAFGRLMIIYRRLKKYRDELRVINKGIQVFSKREDDQLKQVYSNRKNKKQVLEFSKAFMTKAGLKDKKGNSTYFPEPINTWRARKGIVEKKINPGKA